MKYILISLFSLSTYAQDYTYNAKVVSCYDGDTQIVIIDLGLNITIEKTIRLYGVDTPEVRGRGKVRGKMVRDEVRKVILNRDIVLKTIEDRTGKFGRLLAIIFVDIDGDGKLDNLNQWLISEGHAKEYMKD